ncbi:MAG: hypothetical protein JRF71_13395 [Deltaproteobacteria bacterium]|nr:hypothetical protein [Deltaproteobacteria bacterium]
MAPFAARAIIGLIFGFLIYETIKESNKIFGLSLTPYLAFAIVPAVVVYIFQESVIKKLRAYEKAIAITKLMEKRIDKVIYLLAWVFLSILVIFSFVIWAGTIFKLSIQAH